MKTSIYLESAKKIAELPASGVGGAFICNNLDVDSTDTFKDLFQKDAKNNRLWSFTLDSGHNEILNETKRSEAAKNHRLIILTLMHEMQKTGDL